MSTVYVVQEVPKFNISKAAAFGKLVNVLPAGSTMFPQDMISRAKRVLKDYNDDDYLLMIGDPAAMAITIMVASYYNDGLVNLLRWDRQSKVYVPLTVRI